MKPIAEGCPESQVPALSVKIGMCDIQNAGDQYNRDIVRFYGFTPAVVPMNEAELVIVGSVLGWQPDDFTGAILGAGFISTEGRHPYNRADVCAVRGRLSQLRTYRKKAILGDPGLLASEVYSAKHNPKYPLGIVAHYEDIDDPAVRRLAARDPDNVHLIDIRETPAKVVGEISQCGAIASSSLHGIVFGDSLGIPTVLTPLSDRLVGQGFKFYDYYSAFGETPVVGKISAESTVGEIVALARRRNLAKLTSIRGALALLFGGLGETIATVRQRRCSRIWEASRVVRNRASMHLFRRDQREACRYRAGIPRGLRWLP